MVKNVKYKSEYEQTMMDTKLAFMYPIEEVPNDLINSLLPLCFISVHGWIET